MAFVNVKFDDRFEKIDLINELKEKYNFYASQGCFDNESGFILVKIWSKRNPYEEIDFSRWLFVREGCLIDFTKEILEYKKIEDDHYKSVQNINYLKGLANCKLCDKDFILSSMVEAMRVYREIGFYANMKRYDLEVYFKGDIQ